MRRVMSYSYLSAKHTGGKLGEDGRKRESGAGEREWVGAVR